MIISFVRKNILLSLMLVALGAIVCITSINIYVLSFSKDTLFSKVQDVPENEIGLVFGASIINNSIPSDILKDRLKVAANAYSQGKIAQIIVSGDNSKANYNEPEVMKNYLVTLGVNPDHIHADYAGFDTYDSLYRAKELFKVDELTLFTQDFHLKRALYISERLGVHSVGISTNLQPYLMDSYNDRREVFARIKAFLDVEIFTSKPKFLGENLKIYPLDEIQKIKEELTEEK